MKVKRLGLVLVMFASSMAVAESTSPSSSPDANPEDWGIHNGCLSYTRIKRVQFTSNDDGIIELTNGRQALVTLRNHCPGIRNEGYVHKPVNGNFCEGDLLRVVHFGSTCVVGRIEPSVAAVQ